SDTQIIHGSHKNHNEHGKRLGESERELGTAKVKCVERRRHDGKYEPDKAQKRSGKRCHGDGPVKKGAHPAEQKSPEWPQAFGEVNIWPACLGEHCSELGVAKGAKKNNDSAQNPGRKNERCGTCHPCHLAAHKKNARADGVSDDDCGCGPETKAADEFWALGLVS